MRANVDALEGWRYPSDHPERGRMTLLGAVVVDHSAFIAADSLQLWRSAGYGDTVEKLTKLRQDAVVWGWYGNSTAGLDFAGEIESYEGLHQFATWDNLTSHLQRAAEMLDRKYHADEGFSALFAGRLDGEYGFRVYGTHRLMGDDWCFVGHNRLAAKVAWVALRASSPDREASERLRLVMSTTIEASDPFLRPPLHLWRIDAGGCTDLDKEECK